MTSLVCIYYYYSYLLLIKFIKHFSPEFLIFCQTYKIKACKLSSLKKKN